MEGNLCSPSIGDGNGRKIYGSAGGSMIIALFLKLIEADYDETAEMDQVSPIHSIKTILWVKEMASTLKQQQGNCPHLVSLLRLIDVLLVVAFLEKLRGSSR